jgi:hypothetical protein
MAFTVFFIIFCGKFNDNPCSSCWFVEYMQPDRLEFIGYCKGM